MDYRANGVKSALLETGLYRKADLSFCFFILFALEMIRSVIGRLNVDFDAVKAIR